VSHETHERPAQERHSVENDDVISLPLCANGQERASAERHAVESDQDPLQSPYAPKKESAQPVEGMAVEGGFTVSEDAAPHASEGSREHLERRAHDVHDPSLFSRDANGDQQQLERLVANIHAVEREEAAARLPRAAQLRSVPGLAPADRALGRHARWTWCLRLRWARALMVCAGRSPSSRLAP
jgi:hypothetical protein